MKITYELLVEYGACIDQRERFRVEHPDGLEPTAEALICAKAAGYDVRWLVRLLSADGPRSQRAFALWCVEQVAHLSNDTRVEQCLAVVRRRVADPASVTDEELSVVQSAAWEAAGEEAGEAAEAALAATWAVWAVRDAGAVWAVRDAAGAVWVARAAAADAAATVARGEAWIAARGAAREAAAEEAQIAMLAEMLIQCEELT